MTPDQEAVKLVFERDTAELKKYLEMWASNQELAFQQDGANWPREWSIELRRGEKWLKLAVCKPVELGTYEQIHGIWGLRVEGSFWGDRQPWILTRWPDGWRAWEADGPCRSISNLWSYILDILRGQLDEPPKRGLSGEP